MYITIYIYTICSSSGQQIFDPTVCTHYYTVLLCSKQYLQSSVVVGEYCTQCACTYSTSTRRVAVVQRHRVAVTWLELWERLEVVVYKMTWCIHLYNAFSAVASIATVVVFRYNLHMYAGHIHILSVLCLCRIHRHDFKVTYLTIVCHIYYV